MLFYFVSHIIGGIIEQGDAILFCILLGRFGMQYDIQYNKMVRLKLLKCSNTNSVEKQQNRYTIGSVIASYYPLAKIKYDLGRSINIHAIIICGSIMCQ